MAMQATLWQMSSRPSVEGEDGSERPATDAELLNMGIRVETEALNGDEIVHVAPGVAETDLISPPEFTSILNPGWTWEDVPGALRDRLLEARWEDSEGETRRAKIADVPDGATGIESGLAPHYWYGDE